MTIETRLTVATPLIREAGGLAADYFARRATLMRETKGPQDFVGIADREVESLIRTRLAEASPEDGFLGAESGGGAGERCWVVDPIDGTNNFLRGLPLWASRFEFPHLGREETKANGATSVAPVDAVDKRRKLLMPRAVSPRAGRA
jgi:hypothetical protein